MDGHSDHLLCTFVLPLSASVDLASHLLAGATLLFLSIAEVSSSSVVYFVCAFSHVLLVFCSLSFSSSFGVVILSIELDGPLLVAQCLPKLPFGALGE